MLYLLPLWHNVKNPDSGFSPMMWTQPTDAHSKIGLCSSACWQVLTTWLFSHPKMNTCWWEVLETAPGTASPQRCECLLCCPIHPNWAGTSNVADQTWCSSQPTGSMASWTENPQPPPATKSGSEPRHSASSSLLCNYNGFAAFLITC